MAETSGLQVEKERLVTENARLETENTRLAARVLELESQQGIMQAHADVLTTLSGAVNASLADTHRALVVQNEALKNRVVELENQIEKLQKDVDELKARVDKYQVSEARMVMGQLTRAFRGKAARYLFPERYASAELKRRGVDLDDLVEMVEKETGDATTLQKKADDLDALLKGVGLPSWKSIDFAEEMQGVEWLHGSMAHTKTNLSFDKILALLAVEEGDDAQFCRSLLVVVNKLGITFGEGPLAI